MAKAAPGRAPLALEGRSLPALDHHIRTSPTSKTTGRRHRPTT